MARIVNDIVENIPKESSFLSRERREERRGKILTPLDPPPPRGKGKRLGLIFAGTALVLILGFFVASRMSSAMITVTPKSEELELATNLKAFKVPEAPHLLKFEVVEVEGEESVSVPAQGEKYVERKASGKIVVYNDYSAAPLRLVQNTRFKSSDGKVFRTYSAITVPGKGSIEIAVVADAPGASYNIAPSDFTLPGLAGGAMYSKVYGKSKEAMAGGFEGNVKVVSDTELTGARATLEAQLTKKLLAEMTAKLDDRQIFFPGAFFTSYTFNEFAQGENGGRADTQNVSLGGTLYAVVFDEYELAKAIARRELTGIGEEGIEIDNWEELELTLSHYDNLNEVLEMNLRATGKARFLWQYDSEALKKALVGTPKESNASVFAEFPGIDTAEVKVRPFWRKTFPSNPSDIEIRNALDR